MISKAREAAVWERVRSASAEAPMPEEPVLPEASTPELPTPALPSPDQTLGEGVTVELLSQLTEEEAGRCRRYRALARCVCGPARQTLLSLAQKAGAHSRKLAAIYYVRQGRRACPQPEALPCCFVVEQTLRQLYREELEAAARYETLAEGETALRPMFQCMAAEQSAAACRLLQLLADYL